MECRCREEGSQRDFKWKNEYDLFNFFTLVSLPHPSVFILFVGFSCLFLSLSLRHMYTHTRTHAHTCRHTHTHFAIRIVCLLSSFLLLFDLGWSNAPIPLHLMFSLPPHMYQMVSSHCWIHFLPPWLKA